MTWPEFILFASDATLAALWGTALLGIATIALIAEWRRTRRRHIDAVGCMPWTVLFLACVVTGLGLLMMAVRGWLAG